ncbi:AAA family ATPase [Bacillus paralicheniformis]|uniref:AAA family ATPase n=1 Tax=Bacillus paralicheniformis TaxID=1648923 RepID=UPI002867BAB3|nr:AAA family ATPase [Bacillus paralicheniformis]WMW47705.1 AAA family ATPase [Bacillus paralicheniformis]
MSNVIKEFKIKSLFQSLDVNLKFDEVENIYIGENGLGKTTILSTIFYTLTKRFSELNKIEFESIEVIFEDNEQYQFTVEDIEQYCDFKNYFKKSRKRLNPRIQELSLESYDKDYSELRTLIKLKNEYNPEELSKTEPFKKLLDKLLTKTGFSEVAIRRELMEFIKRIEFDNNILSQLERKLDEVLRTHEILYFPTFRRIEEDITKLRAFTQDDEEEKDIDYFYARRRERPLTDYGELIKFGMSDVESTIKNLLEKIRETSINSFNQMTALLLKQYVDNEISSNEKSNKEDIILSDLEISLDRVGSEIGKDYKERIIDLVKNGEIYKEENNYLLNFISNLLASHEQLQTIDNRIEKFVRVCNSYLVNKKYYYDASNVTLQIINNHNKKVIPLKKLSSGEKQIISTFSKIYLEYEKDYIILFDEPELSLSIQWQEQYIPDIIQSGNCSLLICVTHSPFIFREDRLFDISKEILDEIEILDEVDFTEVD